MEEPSAFRQLVAVRRVRADEVAERQDRGTFDCFRVGNSRKRREQARNVDFVRRQSAEHQVIEARGPSSGPLDQFEERRCDETIAVEPQQEVANELAKALACDNPEVVAVVGNFLTRLIEPRRARNPVLGRITAGDD
jgi:hypothetical protein